MLNGTLTLHDIKDVEHFTGAILAGAKLDLTPQDRADLHAYLIELCWELSTRYKPGGIKFSTWARTTLQYRTVDWTRQWNGRTKWSFADHVFEREIHPTLELDDNLGATNLDLPEHREPDQRRLDDRGSISPAAYQPPRDLFPARGIPTPPPDQPHHHLIGEAA